MIHLPTVLDTIKKVDSDGNFPVFDLEVISMDVRRKKAGSVLRFEGVRVHNLEPKPTAGKATNRHKERLSQTTGRDPRHRVHGTLNLEELRTKQIHKIHVRLITRFNGQKVIY